MRVAKSYVDHRTLVLKTDNRPTAVRTADAGKVEIATWGADYAQVFNATDAGKFDFLVLGSGADRFLGRSRATCRCIRWRGRVAAARKGSEAMAQRRIFVWKRRREPQ